MLSLNVYACYKWQTVHGVVSSSSSSASDRHLYQRQVLAPLLGALHRLSACRFIISSRRASSSVSVSPSDHVYCATLHAAGRKRCVTVQPRVLERLLLDGDGSSRTGPGGCQPARPTRPFSGRSRSSTPTWSATCSTRARFIPASSRMPHHLQRGLSGPRRTEIES